MRTIAIFSKLQGFFDKIQQVDANISSVGSDVYKRNLELEHEVKKKTEELNKANNTLLTMNSIWDMMNSSEPLTNVLDSIVNSMQDQMGYVNTMVLTKEHDKDGDFFLVKSHAASKLLMKAVENNSLINIKSFRIPSSDDLIITQALKERTIKSTSDIGTVFHKILESLEYSFVQNIVQSTPSKSVTVVPIFRRKNEMQEKEEFGCMLVFSPNPASTENEIKFLTLFANQIELAITIAGLFEEVRKQAVTDPLTGLYNRRYFEENINREAERALRLGQPFSLVSLDLDHLKTINDTYGHQYGDVAIKTISNVLKKQARSIDIPARIGGEEFNVMLPGVDSYGAMIAAERIRAAIEATPLEKIGNVTASIGVATFLEHSKNVFDLTELADQAMYRAKINGRNQVQMTQKQIETNWQKVAVNAFLDIVSKQRVQIPPELAGDITARLSAVSSSEKNAKEVIYSVVDILTQSYNSTYQSGFTKSKLLLAVKLAKNMDMTKEEVDKLKIAILLYDIGNIMIPENIFKKEDSLTDDEKNLIRRHPVIAAREILSPISSIQDIIPIIEKHHENWDGTGYPGKVSGKDIPLGSQIILLIDAYYALTQDRPYRKAFSIDKALEIIQDGAGSKWSKELVDNFIPLIKHEDRE